MTADDDVTSATFSAAAEPMERGQPCGGQRAREVSHPSAPLHFLNTDAVLARFHPIGRSRASQIIKTDPRFPHPLLGGGAGSKAIYSKSAVDAYFSLVERDGFPHLK